MLINATLIVRDAAVTHYTPVTVAANVEPVPAEPDVGHPFAGCVLNWAHLRLTPPAVLLIGIACRDDALAWLEHDNHLVPINIDHERMIVGGGAISLDPDPFGPLAAMIAAYFNDDTR